MNGEVPVIKIAQVVSVDDEQGGDRIRVRLLPEDASKRNSELPLCWPLLPKMLHVKPQKDETVLIISAIANDGNSVRYYIGPVVSQQNYMESETNYYHARGMISPGGIEAPEENPELDPDTYGAFPNNDDISIVGRRSAELQLKLNEARVKAGVRATDKKDRRKVFLNTKSPSYLKLKYHEDNNGKIGGSNIGDDGYQSTATLVADKIFLLGNTGTGANGKNDTFETSSVDYKQGNITDDLITDDELNKALENAHKIPYGDVLVRYLKTLTKALKEHTHNYATLKPNPFFMTQLNEDETELLDNGGMLSDNIRIN